MSIYCINSNNNDFWSSEYGEKDTMIKTIKVF